MLWVIVVQSKGSKLKCIKKKLHSIKELHNTIIILQLIIKEIGVFCITEMKKKLKSGKYKAVIDTKFIKGSLNFGEIILKGKSKKKYFYLQIFVILH